MQKIEEMKEKQVYSGLEVAIIGIGCRFPGANNWRSFWENLVNKTESVHFFSKEELLERGMEKRVIEDPEFVGAAAILEDKNLFDSNFFDYRPFEAGIMNPAHRVFHECVWEALEDSGYNPDNTKGSIGVYAGAGDDINWRVYTKMLNKGQEIDEVTLSYLTNKEFLTTLLSYKLNLKGPSFTVNTLCSTSLVAVNLACQSLIFGETKIALAGGIRLHTNTSQGYMHVEGSIESSDGHCRTFDKAASGTVSGEGAGVVVLKRLADAIKDRDNIYAVIKGSAVNNDGKNKVGFSAPSVEGQSNCIKKALSFAGIEPERITYVESHGTGTSLGDPVEIEALNIAFNKNKNHKCAIGSLKTNIGHLDVAAGIAGLIKASLCLKFKKIPATLHFEEPNPNIDFNNGPFAVNTDLIPWERKNGELLIAGVNSFGIGGTNAHVIVEEAPTVNPSMDENGYRIIAISAKTQKSLSKYAEKLHEFLIDNPDISLADLSFTSLVGRKHFPCRQLFVCESINELTDKLHSEAGKKFSFLNTKVVKSIVFMFPGQGSQYFDMGKDLYFHEPLFKKTMDEGFAILKQLTTEDFKGLLYPLNGQSDQIDDTKYTQPIIFLLEYALAKLILSYGIVPVAMIGHSLGEYVAACISGVFSFREALALMVKRGVLMSGIQSGTMISVLMNEVEGRKYVTSTISLAAVNSDSEIVFSGESSSINSLIILLENEKIPFVKLKTNIAFHSEMMEPILSEFELALESIHLNNFTIPFISNVTGELILQSEACSKAYWVKHLRKTVLFANGIRKLKLSGEVLFMEVGPGDTLSKFTKNNLKDLSGYLTVNLVQSRRKVVNDNNHLKQKLGELWLNGIGIDWNKYFQFEERNRVSLPTYCFDPIEYPTEVNPMKLLIDIGMSKPSFNKTSGDNLVYTVRWRQSSKYLFGKKDFGNNAIIVFIDEIGLADNISIKFSQFNIRIYTVKKSSSRLKDGHHYEIDPTNPADYEWLFENLKREDIRPTTIFHFWLFEKDQYINAKQINYYHQFGYESLLMIVRAFELKFGDKPLEINILGNGLFRVLGNENIIPEKCTVLAAARIIPLELSNVSCRTIDITDVDQDIIHILLNHLNSPINDKEIAIRGKSTFIKTFENIDYEFNEYDAVFKNNGTYLITGANGGIGRHLSSFLCQDYSANIIMVGRSSPNNDFIKSLQLQGGRVFYIQADISDPEHLAAEIMRAEKLLGPINGVIHTAGEIDYGGLILRRELADDKKVFSAKINGTKILYSIFENKQIDFFVNCSSLAASIPPVGEVAYSAANIFQDALSESLNNKFPMISIEWPAIKEFGMLVNALKNRPLQEQRDLLSDGISPLELIGVLINAIRTKLPVQIISKIDVNELLHNSSISVEIPSTTYTSLYEVDRSSLKSQFVTAQTETEEKVLLFIQTFFGIDNVGIEDDFFELGGDSLKAMIFIKRIKKEFNIDLSLKLFFEEPTVKYLAYCIDQMDFSRSNKEEENLKIIKI